MEPQTKKIRQEPITPSPVSIPFSALLERQYSSNIDPKIQEPKVDLNNNEESVLIEKMSLTTTDTDNKKEPLLYAQKIENKFSDDLFFIDDDEQISDMKIKPNLDQIYFNFGNFPEQKASPNLAKQTYRKIGQMQELKLTEFILIDDSSCEEIKKLKL